MTRRFIHFSWLLIFLIPLISLNAAADTRIKDASGKTVTIEDTERIVSVGGAVTEIIYALGLSDRVVAVDTTSRYLESVSSKPNVGYMRQLAAEPILAMEPSLVLAVQDAGPQTALAQLREAGVPVVLVPDEPSPQGVMEKISLVSAALDVTSEGRALKEKIRSELEEATAKLQGISEKPRVLFLLSVGQGGAPLAAGRATSAEGIIRLAGGRNAVDAFEGFKPLSPEAAVAAAPDVILVTNRSLGLLGGMEGLLELPEVAITPAAKNRRVIAMDGLLLLGFGPRTGLAVWQLAERLHAPDALTSRAGNR